MGFVDYFKFIFGIEHFNAHINAMKIISDEKTHTIERQEKRIRELEELKGKLMSVSDMETLLEREKEAHRELIECIKEKRDLKEQIIFLEYEIKKLKNGKNS